MTKIRNYLRIFALLGLLITALHSHAEYKKAKVGELYYVFDTNKLTATVSNCSDKLDLANIARENRKKGYAKGYIIIPATVSYKGKSYSVTTIAVNAFAGSPIDQAFIPASVRRIGERAFFYSGLRTATIKCADVELGAQCFRGCKNLTTVNLPTGLQKIPNYCFQNSGIESIELPKGVLAIGDGAFKGCSTLNSVKLPGTLVSIGDNAFADCTSLSQINVPKSLKTVGKKAFEMCNNLPALHLSADVTVEKHAFDGSTQPIISGTFKAKVGDLYYVFDGAMHTAAVSNGKPGLIKAGIYSAFAEENRTYAAGNITIPQEIEYSGLKYRVTAIDEGAFYNSPIGGISIPASVTKIGRSAFSNSALRSVSIDCPNVTLGDYLFSQCANLSFVKLPEGLKAIPKAAFSQSGIPYITIPESVTSIGEEAFFKCPNLENITFPAHLTVLPQMVCCHCSALRSVSLPSGLTTIADAAFNGCSQLSDINIPASVTQIGNWAFKDCIKLKKLSLPANVKTGTETFSGSGWRKTSSSGTKAKPNAKTTKPQQSAKPQPSPKKRTSIYD